MVTAKARGESKLAPENWTHIYILLGIALSIEGTVIQMLNLDQWQSNLILYTSIGALTAYLFLRDRRFQGKLGRLRDYENQWR